MSELFEIPIDKASFTSEDALRSFEGDELAYQTHGIRLLDGPPVVGVSLDESGVIRARSIFQIAACKVLGRTTIQVSLDANSDADAFEELKFVRRIVVEEPEPTSAVQRWHSFRFVDILSEESAKLASRLVLDFFESYWSDFATETGSRPFDGPVLLDQALGAFDPTLDLKIWTPWASYDSQWIRQYSSLIRKVHDEVQPLRWSEAGIMSA